MTSRLAIVALAVTATLLSGCSGQPAPEATTPAFTSDAQAFAAAEQTYRNYVDALNHVDLSDPKTFEAVYAWTTGNLNAEDRKVFSRMHADGWVVSGDSVVTVAQPRAAEGQITSTVELAVCVNVSAVALVDSSGASMVDASRTDLQSTLVSVVISGASPTGWLLSDIVARQGEPKCA